MATSASLAARASASAIGAHGVRRACRPARQQLQHCRRAARQGGAQAPCRDVRAAFFKFGGKGSEDAGIYGSQGREDYGYDDVEHYFNYMGMLAVEGTYDRMEAMLNSGLHPVDVLLLMACSENDTPKVEELLKAGADASVKDSNGKTPLELCSKPEVKALLQPKVNV